MGRGTGIAARPQWYFWSIGFTNKVQPYCRLAIITMQMMPKSNWTGRTAAVAVVAGGLARDVFAALSVKKTSGLETRIFQPDRSAIRLPGRTKGASICRLAAHQSVALKIVAQAR